MKKDSYSHLVSSERWSWEIAYKKWFILRFVLLLIALVLSIILGYIYFRLIPHYEQLAEQTPYSSQSRPVVQTIDTDSWATYQDKTYGFMFKYPDPLGAKATSSSNLPIVTSHSITEIDIPVVGAELYTASSSDALYSYVVPSTDSGNAAALESIVMINGKKVTENEMGNSAYVLFKHQNVYYVYKYTLSQGDITNEARALLSTFSFQ